MLQVGYGAGTGDTSGLGSCGDTRLPSGWLNQTGETDLTVHLLSGRDVRALECAVTLTVQVLALQSIQGKLSPCY